MLKKILTLGAVSGLAGWLALEVLQATSTDCQVNISESSCCDFEWLQKSEDRATFRFAIDFDNLGAQQGLVIDARAHLQPAGEDFSQWNPRVIWYHEDAPRKDGYFESVIVPAHESKKSWVKVELQGNALEQQLQSLDVLRFQLHYKYYCRNPLAYRSIDFEIPLSAFKKVRHLSSLPEKKEKKKSTSDVDNKAPRYPCTPLKTELIRPGDDIVELSCQLIEANQGKAGDCIALAETAVAIAQGRLHYCEHIEPSYFARRLNKLFDMNASMSSVYALEMAIREAGLPKILMSTLAGAVGKVTNKPGEFYRVAGRGVTVIDDCTGTLPPFDKHVVMGPSLGDEIVAAIKQRTGVDATIVDANDLGKVDVLNLSNPEQHDAIVEALKPNPQGNAGEMTPLVLIRNASQTLKES